MTPFDWKGSARSVYMEQSEVEYARYYKEQFDKAFLEALEADKPMKTKPFDLQAALRGDPVVTRKGYSVKLIGHHPKMRPTYRLLWDVTLPADERTSLVTTDEEGHFYEDRSKSEFDLFRVVKKKWVLIHAVKYPGSDKVEYLQYDDSPIVLAAAKASLPLLGINLVGVSRMEIEE